MRVSMRGVSATLDQLDLVAVGILDEGDDGGAELHRARCARYLDAFLAELIAGGIDVRDTDGEMAEGRAERIGLLLVPIIGKLDDGAAGLVAIADEGERVASLRHLALTQHLHAEEARVEIERLLQIEDAQHGVQHARSADAGSASVPRGRFRIHQSLPSVPGHTAVRSSPCLAMMASTSSAARRLGDSSPRPSWCSASWHCATCASRTDRSLSRRSTSAASRAALTSTCRNSGTTARSRTRFSKCMYLILTMRCTTHAVNGLTRYATTAGSRAMASSSATVPEAASAASLAAKASYLSRSPRTTTVGMGQPRTAAATISATVAVVGTTTRRSGWRRASSATAPANGSSSRATSPRRLPGSTVSSSASAGMPWRRRKAAPSPRSAPLSTTG